MRFLPGDNLRRNAVLTSLLALSVVYFVYTYMCAPKAERADAVRLRLADLEAHAHRVRPRASVDKAEVLRGIETYKAHLARLEDLIPSNQELASLLETISVEEGLAGVEVTMLRPESPEAGELYDSWSYEMAVEGSYHAIGSFLTAVASLERIMVPADLVLSSAPPTNSEQPGSHSPIVAHFRIRTYVVSSAGTAETSTLNPSGVTPQ